MCLSICSLYYGIACGIIITNRIWGLLVHIWGCPLQTNAGPPRKGNWLPIFRPTSSSSNVIVAYYSLRVRSYSKSKYGMGIGDKRWKENDDLCMSVGPEILGQRNE